MLIDGLAAWRLAYLLVNEYGLFGLSARLRRFTGVVEGLPPEHQNNPLAGILSCVACCSMWTSLLMVFLPHPLRRILAIAGAALLLHRLTDSLHEMETGLMQEIPDAIRDVASDLEPHIEHVIREALNRA